MAIGVLGLQGDFQAHVGALERAGAEARVIRVPDELARISGLVIPGGESTTLLKLMAAYGFWEPLLAFGRSGQPVFGTCAGMILLARKVSGPAQPSLGLIDLSVERNGYGRQRESSEGMGTVTFNGKAEPLPMVFIRAPRVSAVGPGVQTLATWGGDCVMARQGNVLVTAFHPELSRSDVVHRYFIDMA